MSKRRKKFILSAPPAGRRWDPGWYPTLARQQIFTTKSGVDTYTGIPHAGVAATTVGPVCPGSRGLLVPHDWNEMEPNGTTDSLATRFNFTRIKSELDQCAAYPTNNGRGVQYILKFVVKSFRGVGTNPLPADMRVPLADNNHNADGYATYFNPGGSVPDGYSGWRWHTTFTTRFATVIQALADSLGSHPNFAGIVTQETSISFTPTTSVDGYSPAAFQTGLIAEGVNIGNAHSRWRHYPFLNFLHGGGKVQLQTVMANLQPYGAVAAFSDLVTDRAPGNIPASVYPIIFDYANGTNTSGGIAMPGTGYTGGSIQPNEWTGTGVGDPAPVSLGDLFNAATSSYTYRPGDGHGVISDNARDHRSTSGLQVLPNLNIIFPDWHNGGNPQFDAAVATGRNGITDIIAAHPTFDNLGS